MVDLDEEPIWVEAEFILYPSPHVSRHLCTSNAAQETKDPSQEIVLIKDRNFFCHLVSRSAIFFPADAWGGMGHAG